MALLRDRPSPVQPLVITDPTYLGTCGAGGVTANRSRVLLTAELTATKGANLPEELTATKGANLPEELTANRPRVLLTTELLAGELTATRGANC